MGKAKKRAKFTVKKIFELWEKLEGMNTQQVSNAFADFGFDEDELAAMEQKARDAFGKALEDTISAAKKMSKAFAPVYEFFEAGVIPGGSEDGGEGGEDEEE